MRKPMPYAKKSGMRKKRPSRSRKSYYKSGKSRGLSTRETTQVRKIAKKAVMSTAETKYFHTNVTLNSMMCTPAWYESGASFSEVGVLGFCTGANLNSNANMQAAVFTYGQSSSPGNPGANVTMLAMDMNRVFMSTDAVPERRAQALEGLSCRPSYAESSWVLDRAMANVTSVNQYACPYRCRMVRVQPRTRKGAYQVGEQWADPKQSLFLDQFNQAFGIESTDSTGARKFTQREFHMAKVNTRQWRVLEEKRFDIFPGGSYTDLDANTTQVSNLTSQCTKPLKIKHDIGDQLYWDNPEGPQGVDQYASQGFTNEYILFHFIAIGNPERAGPGRVPADDVRITCRPVSTFKDL